jgi:DNA-binding SARP family transcriptional activator
VGTERKGAGRDAPDTDVAVHLLSGFALVVQGEPVDLPFSVQRVVTLLSLRDRPLNRNHVAGMLWPETSDHRASANLRSALWRLNRLGCVVVRATSTTLHLAEGVSVDLMACAALARRVLVEDGYEPREADHKLFRFDLLPDWYDDWLVIEREQFHQLRLRALERICEHHTEAGHFAWAVEVGLAAVEAEPLRESAHRALMKVHLAEGNRSEAVRQFEYFRRILDDELGLEPSPRILELLVA